ncbi:MAG TPA: hypothetical protein VN578_24150 [Candidatus Binatia bacterium]|jgi:hypothetical protein|nr:hypothetical protein [Candidatus Binatia bacterium]
MKNLLKTFGIAAALGLLGIFRAAAFELYVLPEPFPEEGQVLLFGDGDPVSATADEWRSACSLKLDPYEHLFSARMFSHTTSEDGGSGTTFVSLDEPTRASSGGLNGRGAVTSAFDKAVPVTTRIADTSIPEPDGLRLSLLGATFILLRHGRRSASGRRGRLETDNPGSVL